MNEEVRAWGVQSAEIPAGWVLAREFIESALGQAYGEYSPQDIYEGLLEGRFQLWVLWKDSPIGPEALAAAVTQLIDFPNRRVLELLLMAGHDFDTWREQIEVLEAWGVAKGASELRFYGRRGFERAMAPLGYEARYTVCAKRLGVLH